MPEKTRVLHALALDTVGGVECVFAGYSSKSRDERLAHHVLVTRGPPHPQFRKVVHEHAASVNLVKYFGRVKLPRWPWFLRERRLASIVRRVSPDVVLVYNCLGDLEQARIAERAPHQAVNVYYEQGSAWGRHDGGRVSAFLQKMDAVICISHAARRMLELRWGCAAGWMEICHSGVWLDPPQPGSVPKRLPDSDPVRLGFVGRLIAFKAPVVAIHALAELKGSSRAYQLHVAGTGPEREKMEAVARKLGVLEAVHFHGVVADMAGFYSQIHLLLCPSVREPLGCVCAEASLYGCPVIATRVDGIPEIVSDGQTGYCVRPEVPVEDYGQMGGGRGKMPRVVYDPETDGLVSPRLPGPAALADAILRTCEDTSRFEEMSARAHEVAADKFSFERYVASLDRHLLALASRT